MIKKLFITGVITTGLLAVLFSCCGDVKEYWIMKGMTTNFTTYQGEYISTDSTNVDSLNLEISFERDYVSDANSNFSSFFVNRSFATSCPHPGESGLKHEMVSISITSNEDFNSSFPAGSDLSSLCQIENKSFSEYIGTYKSPYSSLWISILEKPDNALNRQFTIHFTFSDGSSVVGNSNSIVWY